jgi:hypothetical protein
VSILQAKIEWSSCRIGKHNTRANMAQSEQCFGRDML